ncbi:phage-type endonuclease, partial [gut metagenome]
MSFVPDFYEWLCEEVDRFWIDNIQGKKEPAATSVQDVLLKFNRHTDGKIIEVNDEIFEAYNSLKEVKKELAVMDEKKAALEEKIKMGFGDAEAISYGGQTIATWKA